MKALDSTRLVTYVMKPHFMRNTVFREDSPIRFLVEGGAQSIAVDNGNLSCANRYESANGRLYRGEASVLLRLREKHRWVMVWASAQEMISGKTSVDIRLERK